MMVHQRRTFTLFCCFCLRTNERHNTVVELLLLCVSSFAPATTFGVGKRACAGFASRWACGIWAQVLDIVFLRLEDGDMAFADEEWRAGCL